MSKKITFIIVEDEALFSLHLARQLHRKGYDVIGRFVSGEQAVDYTRNHIPDVVTMDIGLHGRWNGVETAHKLREFTQAPIIFITGYSQKEIIDRALQIERAYYLPKPLNDREFNSILEKVLS